MPKYLIYSILGLSLVMFWQRKNIVKIKNKIKNKILMVYPESVVSEGFTRLKKMFPQSLTETVEKMYRLETAHFTSGGLKKTNGAGMQAVTSSFPYGWSSLKTFWTENPEFAPVDIVVLNENKQKDVVGSGIKQKFLKFNDFYSGLVSLAYFIKLKNGNAGAWFSTNSDKQQRYINKINQISTRYV